MHNRLLVKHVLQDGASLEDTDIVVGGWVRTGRLANKDTLGFVELNDGSCFMGLQVLLSNMSNLPALTATGASLLLRGQLKRAPPGKKQTHELHASEVLFFGPCNRQEYPISKTALTLEFLRTQTHLRARTNTISAAMRIRNHLCIATHDFFQQQGFTYISTPIITASDCEGAGSMFQVKRGHIKMNGLC